MGDVFNLVESVLVHYYLPQVINFPKLIEWFDLHYSESQNDVMS